MAKKDITLQFTIEYDEEQQGKPAHIFAYQFFNRLGYEMKVKQVKYMNEAPQTITKPEELVDLPIKHHDSMKRFDRSTFNESLKVKRR